MTQPRNILAVTVLAATLASGCQPDATPPESAAALQLVYRADDESSDTSFPWWAAARADGSLVVSKLYIPKLPGILDRNGRVIRVLGRAGTGPGEFTAPSFGALKGDSILLMDFNTGVMLFDPAGVFVRHLGHRIMGAQAFFPLRGDSLLVVQSIRTPESVGLPFHVRAPAAGRPTRSFGTDDRTIDRAFSRKHARVIVAESDSTFWSADLGRYLLERWHINGARLEAIEPKREWFPPMTRNPPSVSVERPWTRVMGLTLDVHGHLLVLIQRARPDWRPSGAKRSRIESARGLVLTEQLQYVEQIIEIIDAASGSLVATVHGGEGYLLTLLRDGSVLGLTAGSDDRELTTLWRIRH
jgi:hypothetical protein